MGFLDLYGGSERLYLDAEKLWWVDLKKSLTNAENDACHEALVKSEEVTTDNGAARTKFDLDTAAYARARVLASLQSWNLTGLGTDEVLPINEESITTLPQVIFTKINRKVDELNSEMGDSEQGNFHTRNKVGHPNRPKSTTNT